MAERRQRVIRVSAELLAEKLGIRDARVVGARFDDWPAMFEFLLESGEYKPVMEGAIPPYTEWEVR